jgi:hypothetical protein
MPVIQYPANEGVTAPNLSSSGIPWMVPKSDMFNSSALSPNWSFLGYTPNNTYSLTERQGWLYLKPYSGANTVIQNDGEHNFTLIIRVDFQPLVTTDEAGLWIINGPETLNAKVFCTANSDGAKTLAFSYNTTSYKIESPLDSIVWLKLIRNEHSMSGFYSSDGYTWTQIGQPINAAGIDLQVTDFNNFTGNQQGLYVRGKPAFFDLYIYRDAYTSITAQNPANRLGVSPTTTYLSNISNNDWALYAGVEFGNNDYKKSPISMELSASSNTTGGTVEVWLDSIDTGKKIAECQVDTTGSLTKYKIFRADVDSVTGSHDVYLKFVGPGTEQLFRINWFRFLSEHDSPTAVGDAFGTRQGIDKFELSQNYPNPFNPSTQIKYSVPHNSYITLKVFNLLGQEVASLFEGIQQPGDYEATFDGSMLSSGMYLYQLKSDNFIETKKTMLLK